MYGSKIPLIVRGLVTGGWIAFCMSSLPLFRGPLPSLSAFGETLERVPIVLAIMRANGDIYAAARGLHVPRRDLRTKLSALGLWPWERDRGKPPWNASAP